MIRKACRRTGAWGRWSFVIDTDAYAGNFERSMLAYTTGVLTQYSRTMEQDLADEYAREVGDPLDALVGYELYDPGDDGYHRARCCIYSTPGAVKYCSVRIFLTRRPTVRQIALLKARSAAFAARGPKYGTPFKIVGYRLIRERIVTHEVTL